ncbi:MAG: tetratricopeptide repeat protein, partial [Candidatus Bipolaricaulia bacterium]
EQGEWLDRLETEHDNLRAALVHFEGSGEVEAELRLGGALWRFWHMRGYLSEGRRWLEGALKRGSGASASVRAKALHGAGVLTYEQGDYGRATELFEESLTLSQELGNKQGIAYSLNGLGDVTHFQGDYERAAELYEEGLALCRELGDKPGIAMSISNLGEVAQHRGDWERATALFEQSLTLWQDLGDKLGIAASLSGLGEVARHQGDLGRAVKLYEESLTLWQDLGHRWGIAECLEELAGMAGANEQPERAARLFGAAEALCEAIGVPLVPADRADYDRDVAAVRAGLDEEAFETAWVEGRTMTLEQAIAYALKKTANG